jgi:uncharacterized protein (DUF486 family)
VKEADNMRFSFLEGTRLMRLHTIPAWPCIDSRLLKSRVRAMLDRILPILMLVGSNIFMTFAWYGHLKHKTAPLLITILASWGIAFFEYSLQVPANRMGSAVYSVVQLKTIQEVITLVIFAGFSAWFLGQPLKWNHYAAFALIVGASFLMFYEPGAKPAG